MKRNIFSVIAFVLMATLSASAFAERLNRHVVAVPQSASGSKYLVTWRMLDTDDDYTTFDVLRNGELVAQDINSSTNYLDTKGSKTAQYQIITRQYGYPVDTTEAIRPWQNLFMQVKLDRPTDVTFHDKTNTYSPNDCSVADADGDGNLELLVKWEPSYPADNSQGGFTGPTFFDCYKLLESDGKITAQKLWRIDMGHNIRSGPHYVPFLFYDFDGDGRAEFIVKTGPGTLDGKGRYVSDVADEQEIKSVDNRKEFLNGGGQVMYGPEFLTVFNGETGRAIHTVYYNPNRGCFVGGAPEGRFDIWGDDYGNRSERYLATVAHLDASQPTHASAVMCRGYYTRSYLWAVDFDGKRLSTRWRHASLSRKTVMTTQAAKSDSQSSMKKDVREYHKATYAGSSLYTAYAQGNHNLTCGDVDGDGMDEIIYGSAAIDHDGTLLWSTGLCHGDAIHMGDLMPDRPGLEVMQIHEDPPFGMHICDAATGELLIHMTGDGDTARGMAADVNPKRGYEFWYFGDSHMYNATDGSIVGDAWSQNFRIYWDGDIYDELLDGIGGGHNQPYLEKAGQGRMGIDGKNLFEYGYSVSCNGTKNTPCLSADIFGDWREEIILFNNEDKQTLNIFTTSHHTDARVPCLLYDHNYRLAITWQNSGYNQPPHIGYYLPDATAARLTPYVAAVGQGAPFTMAFHYNNCQGATLSQIVTPSGDVLTSLPAGLSLTQDTHLCKLIFTGRLDEIGEWQFIFRPNTPSNGLDTPLVLTVTVNDSTGIEDITTEEIANTEQTSANGIYDFSGRKVNRQTSKGVYIQNGKKEIFLLAR